MKDGDKQTGNFCGGGDLARGGATVIRAMRDGKTAAAAIYKYLIGEDHEGTPTVQKASAARAA